MRHSFPTRRSSDLKRGSLEPVLACTLSIGSPSPYLSSSSAFPRTSSHTQSIKLLIAWSNPPCVHRAQDRPSVFRDTHRCWAIVERPVRALVLRPCPSKALEEPKPRWVPVSIPAYVKSFETSNQDWAHLCPFSDAVTRTAGHDLQDDSEGGRARSTSSNTFLGVSRLEWLRAGRRVIGAG